MSLQIDGANNQVLDANGNELLKATATASAVNELTLVNAAAGGNPRLDASGGDTDVSPEIRAKGAGQVIVQSNVPDSNPVGGIPVLHKIPVPAGATGNVDVTLTHKTRVINAWGVKTNAGAGGAGTWTVSNGANAITDAMVIPVTDKAIISALSIDDAYHEISAGGTLRVVRTRTASTDETGVVYVLGVRVS